MTNRTKKKTRTSWDDTAETMWKEITRALKVAGMDEVLALKRQIERAVYAEQAKKLGRSVSAIRQKYRKMARAKEGVGTAGGGYRRGTGTEEECKC